MGLEGRVRPSVQFLHRRKVKRKNTFWSVPVPSDSKVHEVRVGKDQNVLLQVIVSDGALMNPDPYMKILKNLDLPDNVKYILTNNTVKIKVHRLDG